jgi:hypothetical protein
VVESLMAISAETPALQALAALGGIEPQKMAAAFNDPEHLFDHLTLEELARLKAGCDQMAALQLVMVAAMDLCMAYAKSGLVEDAAVGVEQTKEVN